MPKWNHCAFITNIKVVGMSRLELSKNTFAALSIPETMSSHPPDNTTLGTQHHYKEAWHDR